METRKETTRPRQSFQPTGRHYIRQEFDDQTSNVQAIMKDAKGRIGIFPIVAKDIRYFGSITNDEDMNMVDESMLFFSPKFRNARIEAAKDFCHYNLDIPLFKILVKDAQMCLDPSKRILWIETDPDFAKTMFVSMSRTNNRSINVIQYIPGAALERKKGIDRKLKELRLTDPELRYQQ